MAILKQILHPQNNLEDDIYPRTSADMVENLSTVATTGSYNDLIDKPTIPTLPTNLIVGTNVENNEVQLSMNGNNVYPKLESEKYLHMLNVTAFFTYENIEFMGRFTINIFNNSEEKLVSTNDSFINGIDISCNGAALPNAPRRNTFLLINRYKVENNSKLIYFSLSCVDGSYNSGTYIITDNVVYSEVIYRL